MTDFYKKNTSFDFIICLQKFINYLHYIIPFVLYKCSTTNQEKGYIMRCNTVSAVNYSSLGKRNFAFKGINDIDPSKTTSETYYNEFEYGRNRIVNQFFNNQGKLLKKETKYILKGCPQQFPNMLDEYTYYDNGKYKTISHEKNNGYSLYDRQYYEYYENGSKKIVKDEKHTIDDMISNHREYNKLGDIIKDITEKWNYLKGMSIINNITKKVRHA